MTDADGRCTRLSHDHSLDEARRAALVDDEARAAEARAAMDRIFTPPPPPPPFGGYPPIPMKGKRRQRPGDQPLPIPNDAPDIQSQVIADVTARRELGIARYGTPLQPDNGRDALRDAYEEALDLAMYLKQAIVERDGRG
jgi:hypothetical protein